MSQSPGFGKKAFQFLRALEKNNTSAWFAENRPTFEEHLRAPMCALLTTAAERARTKGLPLQFDPKKGLFRMNRDIRFSKDKALYKTHLGAVLSRSGEKADPGCVYVHIDPKEPLIAAGFWMADPILVRKFRAAIGAAPDDFVDIVKKLERKNLVLGFEEGALTRMPRGYEQFADHACAQALKAKSYTVSLPLVPAQCEAGELLPRLVKFMSDAAPWLQFGWKLAGPYTRPR